VSGFSRTNRQVPHAREPDSIVVKIPMDQRAELIAAQPDVYYITEHYVNYPSVLVRLPRIHTDALRDLLGMAWRFAHESRAKPRARRGVKK
jgi:hypothetical protein